MADTSRSREGDDFFFNSIQPWEQESHDMLYFNYATKDRLCDVNKLKIQDKSKDLQKNKNNDAKVIPKNIPDIIVTKDQCKPNISSFRDKNSTKYGDRYFSSKKNSTTERTLQKSVTNYKNYYKNKDSNSLSQKKIALQPKKIDFFEIFKNKVEEEKNLISKTTHKFDSVIGPFIDKYKHAMNKKDGFYLMPRKFYSEKKLNPNTEYLPPKGMQTLLNSTKLEKLYSIKEKLRIQNNLTDYMKNIKVNPNPTKKNIDLDWKSKFIPKPKNFAKNHTQRPINNNNKYPTNHTMSPHHDFFKNTFTIRKCQKSDFTCSTSLCDIVKNKIQEGRLQDIKNPSQENLSYNLLNTTVSKTPKAKQIQYLKNSKRLKSMQNIHTEVSKNDDNSFSTASNFAKHQIQQHNLLNINSNNFYQTTDTSNDVYDLKKSHLDVDTGQLLHSSVEDITQDNLQNFENKFAQTDKSSDKLVLEQKIDEIPYKLEVNYTDDPIEKSVILDKKLNSENKSSTNNYKKRLLLENNDYLRDYKQTQHNNINIGNLYFMTAKNETLTETLDQQNFHVILLVEKKIRIANQNAAQFGLINGHGVNKVYISQMAHKYLIQFLKKYLKANRPYEEGAIKETLKNSLLYVKKNMIKNSYIRANVSGVNICYSLIIAGKIFTVNIGGDQAMVIQKDYDSRLGMVLFQKLVLNCEVNSRIDTFQTHYKGFVLNKRHDTFNKSEMERTSTRGGHVNLLQDKHGEFTGEARISGYKNEKKSFQFTRTIGDFDGINCGIISEPEVFEKTISPSDVCLVIATNCIWKSYPFHIIKRQISDKLKANDSKGLCEVLYNKYKHLHQNNQDALFFDNNQIVNNDEDFGIISLQLNIN